MAVIQLLHTLSYGDAISGEAITIDRLLKSAGITSSIVAINIHEKYKGSATIWREDLLQSLGTDDILILHYSIGSPLNKFFTSPSGTPKRVVIYHNLTPPEWFAGYNSRVRTDLLSGKAELLALLNVCDLVISDSEYNNQELIELGYSKGQVLHLPLDRQKWDIPANPGISSILKSHGGKNLLHVGRIAPNKKIEDIIKAFYFYHHKIERKSRLWLVGHDIDTEIYSFELRSLVSELLLKEAVFFVGNVADTALRAFYEGADIYLAMSEHEGFCVPILEAMHFSVPIIAYNAGAIPQTINDAGILINEKDPAKLSELIDIVITDKDLRKELISQGQKRIAMFSEEAFFTKFSDLVINRLVGGGDVQLASRIVSANTSLPCP